MKEKDKLKICYISTVTSEKKMNQIIQNSKNKPLQSIQKFHRLICEGFVSNGMQVEAVSAIPMSRKISDKLFWNEKKESVNGVEYNYLPFINIPIIRQLCIMFFTFYNVIKLSVLNGKTNIFVCDILNTTISTTTLILAKIFKRKCVAIVTDLPRDIGSDKSISKKINEFFQSKYDAYIILTEAMNQIVNPKRKKYEVIEGIANIQMNNISNELEEKYKEKICIYAGGLYSKYGVETLINAFMKIQDKDVRLHLYGEGELVEKIKQINNTKIRYFGVVPNNQVVKEEIKATLLINPRFTNEEYTKYSFPSKNMEYMSTGTPILTTKLPGMPKEYYKYIYMFEDESVEGYYNTLKNVLSKPKEELHTKGLNAKEFVLNSKNNIIQTKKIIDMVSNI